MKFKSINICSGQVVLTTTRTELEQNYRTTITYTHLLNDTEIEQLSGEGRDQIDRLEGGLSLLLGERISPLIHWWDFFLLRWGIFHLHLGVSLL